MRNVALILIFVGVFCIVFPVIHTLLSPSRRETDSDRIIRKLNEIENRLIRIEEQSKGR